MRVLQLKIENFRGIKNADLTFDGGRECSA